MAEAAQEAAREGKGVAGGMRVVGQDITDAEDVAGMRAHTELISITGWVHITARIYVSICVRSSYE